MHRLRNKHKRRPFSGKNRSSDLNTLNSRINSLLNCSDILFNMENLTWLSIYMCVPIFTVVILKSTIANKYF